MTTWTIVNMERDASTGFVNNVHWTCSDVDGDYSGSTYGSLGLSGELTIPYEDLTEATVIGWVKASMGEETVAAHEAAVAAQIADAKEPKWLLVCLGNIAKPSRFLGGTLKGKRWKTKKHPSISTALSTTTRT
jgi:hypothetical protein